jgi:hypothetical protein
MKMTEGTEEINKILQGIEVGEMPDIELVKSDAEFVSELIDRLVVLSAQKVELQKINENLRKNLQTYESQLAAQAKAEYDNPSYSDDDYGDIDHGN